MSVEIVRYLEPLNAEEIAFLRRKEIRERRQLYKTVRILTMICFAFPFAMAWGQAIVGVPNPFSYGRYFTGVGILLFLTAGGTWMAYKSNLYNVHKDLKRGTKTIERATITQKRFMPQNNTCYFFLDSPTKLSIEVASEYYDRLNIGDEVNIEYSTYGKSYFGYF
jgi:hypothetical protein